MSTLETQYQNYLKENPHSLLTYDEWLNYAWKPYISDDFQIGPDGVYEYTDEDHNIALTRIKELENIINKLKDIKEFLNDNEI